MTTHLKLALSSAMLAGLLLATGGAEAAKFTAHVKLPLAYDQFDSIKHPGSHVTLNPQPLPPFVDKTAGLGLGNPGAKVGFNPQPDPPGDY